MKLKRNVKIFKRKRCIISKQNGDLLWFIFDLIDWLSVAWLINSFEIIDWLSYWLIKLLIDYFIDWLINLFIDKLLIDWLIDWLKIFTVVEEEESREGRLEWGNPY